MAHRPARYYLTEQVDKNGYHTSRCAARRLLDGRGPLALSCESEHTPDTGMDSLPYRRTGSGANVVFLSSFIPKVSFDGGRTFRPARAPWYEDGYWAFDLQAVPTAGGQSAIMAQSRQAVVDGKVVYGPQLARTDDAGRTWTELTVDLPNFDIAERVVVTPTGRILAASWSRGIGCSEDGGRTWSRLCPTPDTAYAVVWRET